MSEDRYNNRYILIFIIFVIFVIDNALEPRLATSIKNQIAPQTYLGGTYGTGINAHLLDLIIQQHDTIQATSDSFENLTIYLENVFGTQGVRFVTVADCLNNILPPFRPYPNRPNEPTLSPKYFSLREKNFNLQ
jgi:hypothetical protein